MSVLSANVCAICRHDIDEDKRSTWSLVRATGLNSLLQCSELRNDVELKNYLTQHPSEVKVHADCRKNYTSKRRIEQELRAPNSDEVIPSKTLRSSLSTAFKWKEHCMLCGKPAEYYKFCKRDRNVSAVETLEIRDSVLRSCSSRNDEWALEVQSRLNMCCDLVAEEAVYHRTCFQTFSKLRPCPSTSTSSDLHHSNKTSVGRPVSVGKFETFEDLCSWMEVCDDELHTLDELKDKMDDLAGGDEGLVYSKKQLKSKLEEKYGNHICFAEVAGKKNVVCFKNMASCIISDQWYNERKSKEEDESLRIVIAAAKLVKEQIRQLELDINQYPMNSDYDNVDHARSFLPTLINAFLENIVCDSLKQVSLGHCIVQASRPRSIISPIPFGLGISLDHVFGSQWLLNTLGRLGFTVSYDEVNRYKQSVMQCDVEDLPNSYPTSFTQFSGDNVDHNICTLNGVGSFHGMGIISMSTPCSTLGHGDFRKSSVTRLKRVSADHFVSTRGVKLLHYQPPNTPALCKLLLKPVAEVRQLHSNVVSPSSALNLLWHTGFYFQNDLGPRSNWAGFMHDASVASDIYNPVSDIRMLPIIDRNPNDLSCIFSTLLFIENQSKKLNMETACVTFDQPLWIKSVEIVQSSKMNIVCRLGGFHLLMNFLGAVGSIMAGSGLSEVMETCYGPLTVTYMMTGKAYAKALRGHFLVESALTVLLLKGVFSESVVEGVEPLPRTSLNELKELYSEAVNHNLEIENDSLPLCVQKLASKLNDSKMKCIDNNRTASLWVQYVYYVGIIKQFLTAERTSDWSLHLQTVSQMLPLFAASGHTNYAKCARLYLQLMSELPESHPWIHQQLSSRRHTVRRSNRHWAGLSTDLAIEQVMMRAVKSRGGLTHGRGMTDSVRLSWVSTMHDCASVHSAITSLTNLEHSSTDNQHSELGESRIKRNGTDLCKVIDWLEVNNPFTCIDKRLHGLSSGIVASESDGVNCDNAEEIGERIMTSIDNLNFNEIVLRKIDRAKTLGHLGRKVASGDKRLPVDSSVLFSRLLVVMQREPDISPMFKHELTALPTAFFKGESLRKADKALLAKELRCTVQSENSEVKDPAQTYVVDGGWLVHKVKWQSGVSYFVIANQYSQYLSKHFGSSTTVVFDGYEDGPTIKDQEHIRRGKKAAPDVVFESHKIAYGNQEVFLANTHNKKAFVAFLITEIQQAGFTVYQAVSDADTMIVDCALKTARNTAVTVVANDTDILVLLIYHFQSSMCDIFLHCEVSSRTSGRLSVSSIRDIRSAIGDNAAEQILAIHAVSGCDSTSALYGQGKGSVWKKVTGSQQFRPLTDVINACDASHESVVAAGLQFLVLLYGGRKYDSLNSLRYARYMDLTASSTVPLRPERLPPTENAARFHIYRVHFQVVQWKTLMNTDLKPEDWGWNVIDGCLFPIATDLTAAPESMLKIIRCKCMTETRHPCSAMNCTCVKYGLSCVASCKHSKGCDCENAGFNNTLEDCEDTDEVHTCLLEDVMSDEALDFAIPWNNEVVV